MSLNKSTVEEAALSWFRDLGYPIGHGPNMAPGEPAAGAGFVWRRRAGWAVARGLLAAESECQSRALPTLRNTLLPKLLSPGVARSQAVEVSHE